MMFCFGLSGLIEGSCVFAQCVLSFEALGLGFLLDLRIVCTCTCTYVQYLL